MAEEMGARLKQELEDILQKKADPPPCRYHRLVPPPGCILGWDLAQCEFCSFYKPVEGMEDSESGDDGD